MGRSVDLRQLVYRDIDAVAGQLVQGLLQLDVAAAGPLSAEQTAVSIDLVDDAAGGFRLEGGFGHPCLSGVG